MASSSLPLGQVTMLILAMAVVSAGCGSSQPAPVVPSASVVSSTPGVAASASGSVPSVPLSNLPDTTAAHQLRWVLQAVAASSGPSADDIGGHFSATFLADVSPAQLAAVFSRERAAGPLRLQSYVAPTATSVEAGVAERDGARLLIDLAVDGQGKVSTLLLKPAPPLPIVATVTDLQKAASGLGIFATVLTASVDRDGTCTTTQTLGDQGPRPLGSMFKLYVLGAVVNRIQAGLLQWDTSLTVTAAIKSLPSGQLQTVPDGTKVTVRQAATLMISISDNTAADLLIQAVGQPALAAAVTAMGNTHPALLTPFLTTKQMFTLQYDDPTARTRWAAASPAEVNATTGTVTDPSAAAVATRTALVRQLPTATPTTTTTDQHPGWMDGIEWYASPLDICRAHAALQQIATTPAGAPVADILARNPGVDVGHGWSYVGYKGGEDAGVLTGSWYLKPAGGDATVAIVQFAATDPTKIPDVGWFAIAAGGLIQHLPR